jgi:hypothetical protein
VYDYRRGLDWWLYTHDSWLHFTGHWHTQTSVLSLLVSTSRFLATDFNTGTITVSPNYTLQISHRPSSESYVPTDGQPASLSWNKAAIRGLRPDFISQSCAGLLMWGALSDDRAGLSFTTAAGPRQRSHSRVRVPWDSRPYFTVGDSRLPFSSPPTTRRATVEVSDPASTRVLTTL